MIVKSNFKPAWWLPNPHLQTMWGSLLRRHPKINIRRERVELPDGDFLDTDWIEPKIKKQQTPIIMVLHGLGGSIDSHYARAIMNAIYQQGWRGVFMHYRGCSGTPNRKPFSYHSGYTDDVKFVVEQIQHRETKVPMAAVGYSLGGSILLNWLGQSKQENPLDTAIAISVPFELNKAADRMQNGASRMYQWHILRSLRQGIAHKFSVVQSPIDLSQLHELKTIWEIDTHITAPLHGFKDAADYYQRASSRRALKTIAIPTLILHAEDDPFMSPDSVPKSQELSDAIQFELSPKGGHVGFISGKIPGKPRYWLEERVIQHLKDHL